MSWSHMVAAQNSKSAFVEISERSASAARLLQEAQAEQSSEQALLLAREVTSRWSRLLRRIVSSGAAHPGEARG